MKSGKKAPISSKTQAVDFDTTPARPAVCNSRLTIPHAQCYFLAAERLMFYSPLNSSGTWWWGHQPAFWGPEKGPVCTKESLDFNRLPEAEQQTTGGNNFTFLPNPCCIG